MSAVELPPDEAAETGPVAVFRCQGGTENGRVIGQAIVLKDISRVKNVERQQSEFLDSVAHELRTPLRSILGCVELLIVDKEDDAQT